MTREDIERLADQLIEPYGENISRRTRAADALLALLADRDRLERERDESRNVFISVCEKAAHIQYGLQSERDEWKQKAEAAAQMQRAVSSRENDYILQLNAAVARIA